MSQSFEIREESFYINGKKTPLLCGEIHYFRMPKSSWANALDRLAECGCNAVAYYVPWFVHEYEEGKFDFHGDVHPDNDLHTWIRMTMERGLIGYLRPGPYVYAETRDLGLPVWFTRKYKDAIIKGYQDGRYVDTAFANGASHNHPDFLEAVRKWYRALCGEVEQYLYPEGNVALFQLCNEIPGDDCDDRNPRNLGIGDPNGLWPSWLRDKYQTVENLNRRYGSSFQALELVEPHHLEARSGKLYFEDHLDFYYTRYFPEYFRRLKEMVCLKKEHPITFVHNAYNPRAISLHYHNRQQNPWLNVGVDCYYSLSGRIGMKEATYYCEYGAEYARRFLNNVPWVIEQECGYWTDYPAVYGPELYIFNIWTMAAGYQGMNMYLFASGINRPGMGFYGTEHNWQAPVDAYGRAAENYPYIERSIRDILKHQDVLLSGMRYDIGLGVRHAPGLIWKAVAKPSNEAYFALKSAGFTPRIYDYEAMNPEELLKCPVLFIVSDECMEPKVQENLAEYVRLGGRLIISGIFPYLACSGSPCTLLGDAFGLTAGEGQIREEVQGKLILDGVEYFIGKKVQQVTPADESGWKIAAASESGAAKEEAADGGRPGALLREYGEGSVMVLPFPLEMQFYGMADMLVKLLSLIGAHPGIRGARRLRILPKEDGSIIALNLHPMAVRETVSVDTPGGEKTETVDLEPHSFRIGSGPLAKCFLRSHH